MAINFEHLLKAIGLGCWLPAPAAVPRSRGGPARAWAVQRYSNCETNQRKNQSFFSLRPRLRFLAGRGPAAALRRSPMSWLGCRAKSPAAALRSWRPTAFCRVFSRKRPRCATSWSSVCCGAGLFAVRKRPFCSAKRAVLHGGKGRLAQPSRRRQPSAAHL